MVIIMFYNCYNCFFVVNCNYSVFCQNRKWWESFMLLTAFCMVERDTLYYIFITSLWQLTFRKTKNNQLTSKVNGGETGRHFWWSVLPPILCSHNPTTTFWPPSSATVVSTEPFFARNRDTAVPAERNSDLQTLICVLAARPRWCFTCRILSSWLSWMMTYPGYTLQMKMLFLVDQLWFMTRIREEEEEY